MKKIQALYRIILIALLISVPALTCIGSLYYIDYSYNKALFANENEPVPPIPNPNLDTSHGVSNSCS